jgi:hypothetical protein
MGAQLRFGTVGATGGGFASQPGSLQPAFAEPTGRAHWCYQRRSPHTWRDPYRWYSQWSFGCRVGAGAPIGSDGAGWYDLSMKDLFEPYSRDGAGTQSIKFIKGAVADASGNAVSGAVVQGFVTATDAYTGEAQSREDGSYEVPTQNPGVAHYVVAYLAGSPDRGGTSVNTLIPANLDGT